MPLYQNESAFFIGSGPSFASVDPEILKRHGIVTMGVNNSPKSFRPNLWISVDHPSKFIHSVWIDPTITKFVKEDHLDQYLFDSTLWTSTERTPRNCPNVIGYKSNLEFTPSSFLSEDSINWGNDIDRGGGRSVLLAALKVLFCLGFRHVFLVGVDFNMKPDRPYHFKESCSPDHSSSNQKAYCTLSGMLEALRPVFLAENFNVWNCNPDSNLSVFPFLPLNEAISFAIKDLPEDFTMERTEGLYERIPGGNDSIDSPDAQEQIPLSAGGLSRVSREKKTIQILAKDLSTTERPESSGFITMANNSFEWLLPWWIHHLKQTNPDRPIHVFDLGMSDIARRWLTDHGISWQPMAINPRFRSPWFMKPYVMLKTPFKHTVFLDLDCEVRRNLDDLFGWSTKGLVLGRDLHPFSKYGKLFRRDHFFNSGLIGLESRHAVLSLWREATEHLHDKLRGDQEILNLTIYENELPVVVLPEHYHQLRLDGDHPDAAVMHWTGPAGKKWIRSFIADTALHMDGRHS